MIIIESSLTLITLLITIFMQLIFFFVAYSFRFDKVTDLAGSSNFVLLALFTLCTQKTYYTRQIVSTLFVVVWGIRLGSYLLIRVLKRGKDDRFDKMRDDFFKFLGFWIFQMIWVWIVSLPLTFLNAANIDVPINALDYIGWIFWIVGFVFEVESDRSKDDFLNKKSDALKVMNCSLWKYSRHPNYFGEILLWFGIFLSSCSVFADNLKVGFVSILSPVFTFAILMFLSGVPLAEEKSDRRYGESTDYAEYKSSTSPLIPLPNSFYRNLPFWVKKWFFFEYDSYWVHFQSQPQQ